MKTMKKLSWLAAIALTAIISSCKGDDAEPVPAPAITSFGFYAADNSAVLAQDYICTVTGTAITVSMPVTVDKTSLIARFETNTGDIVKVSGKRQQSGVTANDFTEPVDYVTTNSDSTLNALYSVTISKAAAQSWTAVPAFSTDSLYAGTVMSVNPADNSPYIAYKIVEKVATDRSGKIGVAKYADGAWAQIGKDPFSSEAYGSELDMDFVDGKPYVAYENTIGNKPASVMKYDGSTWKFVGDTSSSDMQSTKIHFAALSANEVVLGQVNNSAKASFSRRLMVMSSFNGTAWANAENAALASGSQMWDLRMCKAGKATYMVCQSRATGYAINVLKYENGKWTAIRSGFIQTNATGESIAVLDIKAQEDGTVYLLTSDDADTKGTYKIRLEKYDPKAQSWSTVGGATLDYIVASITSLTYAKVAVSPSNTPYVAYRDVTNENVKVFCLDPETKQWTENTSITTKSCSDVNIAFTSTGIGYLGYRDGDGHYQLYQYK